jgi:hypothetical protein
MRVRPFVFAALLVGGAVSACDNSDLEARVRKLEESNKKYQEVLDVMNNMYEQQKGQQAAKADNEPDPNAMFAVDIADDIKGGQVEGPATAGVTVVEAWDFA